MNEDTTRNLSVDAKLDLLLTELAAVKTEFGARLSRLEAIVEDRARDTRPMLNQLHQEIAETRAELRELRAEVLADRQEWRAEIKEIKDRLERMEIKMDLFNAESFEMRPDHGVLDRRLTKLERQAA